MALAMKRDILLNIYDRALAELAKDQTLSNENTRPGDLTITFLITLFVNQHRVSFQTSFRYSNLRDFLNFFFLSASCDLKEFDRLHSSVIDIQISRMIRQPKIIHENVFCFSPSKDGKKILLSRCNLIVDIQETCFVFSKKNVSTKIL